MTLEVNKELTLIDKFLHDIFKVIDDHGVKGISLIELAGGLEYAKHRLMQINLNVVSEISPGEKDGT